MTGHEVRQANQALLDRAARLVDELEEHPAGSVLRCFSRAVRLARLAGCPPSMLPDEAERRARTMLAVRAGQVAVTQSPAAGLQRRAG